MYLCMWTSNYVSLSTMRLMLLEHCKSAVIHGERKCANVEYQTVDSLLLFIFISMNIFVCSKSSYISSSLAYPHILHLVFITAFHYSSL